MSRGDCAGGMEGGLLRPVPAPAPWPGPSPAFQSSSNLPYRNTQPKCPRASFTPTVTPGSWKPPQPHMSLFPTPSALGRGSSWSGRGGHLLAQSPAASALSDAAQLPARPTEQHQQHQRRFGDSDDSHLPPPYGDTSLRFRGQGAGRGSRLCVTLTSPRLLPHQLPLGGQMAHGDTAVRGPSGHRIGDWGNRSRV